MSDEAEQNKSERPTDYKLKKAREKGTVARGTDLAFLTALGAFTGWAWVAGRGLAERLGDAGRSSLVAAPQVLASPNEILAVTGATLGGAVRPLALLAGILFGVVLTFELVQTGLVFTTQPLSPDFGRLNPANGLKRVFSFRMLVETGKNLLKLGFYVAAAWIVISAAVTTGATAVGDAATLAEVMGQGVLRLLGFFVVAAVVFAAADQLISRGDFLKKMRMSRREIKREHRDSEGDARIKSKRKQLHSEFAKTSRSLKGIKGADVLVVNPSHYAVALKYEPRRTNAPVVVSKGKDQVALRLKRLAFTHGVAVISDPPLARALFAGVPLDCEVAESFFPRIAAIYRSLRTHRETSHVRA